MEGIFAGGPYCSASLGISAGGPYCSASFLGWEPAKRRVFFSDSLLLSQRGLFFLGGDHLQKGGLAFCKQPSCYTPRDIFF